MIENYCFYESKVDCFRKTQRETVLKIYILFRDV